ncbi:MAG: M1 family metallopeptidase [Sandaracinaceae bacterium]
MSTHRRLGLLLSMFALAACGGSGTPDPEYSAAGGRGEPSETSTQTTEADPVPHGRLPEGVTPLAYTVWIEAVPSRDRFRGRVDIRTRLDAATDRIWLHGRELNVTQAEVLPDGGEAVRAVWEQHDEEGVASLTLAEPVEAGEVILSISYDAPFDRQLKGLYRVDTGGESYAFTQFEATSARLAFPCFDEPRFKTPFEMTLSVLPDHEAIANTLVVSETRIGEMKEVRFAPTLPLPTYLIAMAIGPLDVVEHAPLPANDVRSRPLPFRGVAVRGQGERLAYALEHTGALLADLEAYFGVEYPYDKLDIIAVPDFASGAMENAGAITFRETLLLLDPDNAPERQRRGFAYVMAHELAHQWFGNLVTMPWWDDIWLNEAFATWMGNKVIRHVHPEHQAHVAMVDSVHGAMRADSLANARQIRQPIESNHDIRNAFDSITYRKGGGVLEMFERWLGEDTFRDGIRAYMAEHRFGTATADDLLASLTQTAQRDVTTPFRTFLFQPGVPLLSARRECGDDGNRLHIEQSRYFPVGSEGERAATWQIPVCVRWGSGRQMQDRCTLVTEASADIDLGDACPDWVMPNADAAGYYRFALPPEDLARLMDAGWSRLTERERLSVADNLAAGFDAGTIPAADVYRALPRVAQDDSRAVANTAIEMARFADEHLVADAQRDAFREWADGLFSRRARTLGWGPRRGRSEDGETALLRVSVQAFMAQVAHSERARREAAERGERYLGADELDPDAVQGDLVPLTLAMAIEDGDTAMFDRLLARVLASDDALFRGRGMFALANTHDPALSQRVLALNTDERVRVNEVGQTLSQQLSQRETQDAAWTWMQAHFDEVFSRVATTRAGYAPYYVSGFCSEARAAEVEAFFGERIESLPGGPRNLRNALERIRNCAARAEAQRESATSFFEAQ